MYWKLNREEEIEKVISLIQENAFKIDKKALVIGKNALKIEKKAFTFDLKPPQEINLKAFRKGKIITKTHPYPAYKNENMLLSTFISKIAKLIWRHMQHADENAADDIIERAKNDNNRLLKRIEKYLDDFQQFKPSAIRKTIKILSDDLNKTMEKSKKESKDFNRFVKANARNQEWIYRENILINQLKQHYQIHTKLPEDPIIYNLSLIFGACGLWPERENHYEAMKKRFQKINKEPDEYLPSKL